MQNNIVNIDSLDWQTSEYGNFAYQEKRLGITAGGQMLGTTYYKLMPGKKAFPYHYHYANEEAIFVLEGSGTLRLNNKMLPIVPGDYIALPPGPECAHQIINTAEQPLIFLCFSTMNHPDVVEYPDSNKVGITAGSAPGGDIEKGLLKARFCKQDAVDYFFGEE